ncbi:MAG: trigger factor [Firmicutes bacterium]|nr:trigger factor [Bacillota bacterium]
MSKSKTATKAETKAPKEKGADKKTKADTKATKADTKAKTTATTKAPKEAGAVLKNGYTVESLSESKVKFVLLILKDEFTKAEQEAYNKTKHKYKLQGFRPGKVPMRVIQNTYGSDVFFDDAMDIVFTKKYREILDAEESNFEIVSRPSLTKLDQIKNVEKDANKLLGGSIGDLLVQVEVEVMPPITLGKYTGFTLSKIKHKVSEKDVADAVEQEREKHKREVEVTDTKRKSKTGDILTFDFAGSVDGVLFEGGSAEQFRLELGSKQFIPGFEEQLVGLAVGEQKDVNVTFPTDYQAEHLAGKDAVFKCKVHKIEEVILPKADDEFAKDVSEFKTFKEYKADVKAKLEKAAKEKEEAENNDALYKKVLENTKFELPKMLVDEYSNMMLHDMQMQLTNMGIPIERYFEMMGTTREGYLQGRYKQDEATVKFRKILEAIVEAEKITVTDKELTEIAKKRAAEQNISVDEFLDTRGGKENGLQSLRKPAALEKAMKFIRDNNSFKD